MSDGSQVVLRYSEESPYKTPGSGFQVLRNKGDTLAFRPTFIESDEITQDTMSADDTMVDARATGSIEGELSYGTYDDFVKWVLASDADWGSPVTASGSSIKVGSASTFTDTGTAFAGMSAGEIVRSRAMHNSSNNGWHVLTAAANNLLTVLPADLVTDATGAAGAQIRSGSLVRNGTTFASAFFEREYGDLSNDFATFPGGAVQAITFAFARGRQNNVRIDIVAADELSASATAAVSVTAANTNPVMNAVRNVKVLRENHVDLDVRSLEITFRRSLRERANLTDFGLSEIGIGSLEATVTFEAYYASKALFDKHRAETETNLFFVVEDNAGNGYAFWLPRVKINELQRSGGGRQTDVLVRGRFRALKGALEGAQVARFAN